MRHKVLEMSVSEILTEWLKKNKYDGLWCDECGCGTDDLMPCDINPMYCRPGYNRPDLHPEGEGMWICAAKKEARP